MGFASHPSLLILLLQCPTFRREADGSETPEPFAAEAKFFTESRLLQRDVQIILESCHNQNILGTILHPVSVPMWGLGWAVQWRFGELQPASLLLELGSHLQALEGGSGRKLGWEYSCTCARPSLGSGITHAPCLFPDTNGLHWTKCSPESLSAAEWIVSWEKVPS